VSTRRPDKRELARKYDRGAATYRERFADPDAIAQRQVDLVRGWGVPVSPGARILELGCADGVVTEGLARAGYHVTAVDLSSEMVSTARHRLVSAGLSADVAVADVERLPFDEPFDAVLAVMRAFFSYVPEPQPVLERLRELSRGKVLVDANPRTHPRFACEGALRAAGFGSVAWRASFVPQGRRSGPVVGPVLRAAERVPGVRDAILQRKFSVILKGED